MDDRVNEFLDSACLTYSDRDGPDQIHAAREMLSAHPELSQTNVWAAACAGDVGALTKHLVERPQLVTSKGGPQDWEPLLYATYSRLNVPGTSTLDAARILLEQGAERKCPLDVGKSIQIHSANRRVR